MLDMTNAPWGASHSEPALAAGLAFVSGQVPRDERNQAMAAGDVSEQTRVVFRKLEDVLARVGSGLNDLVMVRTFLVNRDDLQDYLEVRKEFLTSRPACTTVIVAGLSDPGFRLEVEAVATIPSASDE